MNIIRDLQITLHEVVRRTAHMVVDLTTQPILISRAKAGDSVRLNGHLYEKGRIVEPRKLEEYTQVEQDAARWNAENQWKKMQQHQSHDVQPEFRELSHDKFIERYSRHEVEDRLRGLDVSHSTGEASYTYNFFPRLVSSYIQEIYGDQYLRIFARDPNLMDNLPPIPEGNRFSKLSKLRQLALVHGALKEYDEAFERYIRDESDVAAWGGPAFVSDPGPKDDYVVGRVHGLFDEGKTDALTHDLVSTYWSKKSPDPYNPKNPNMVFHEQSQRSIETHDTSIGYIAGIIPIEIDGPSTYTTRNFTETRYMGHKYSEDQINELRRLADKVAGTSSTGMRPHSKKSVFLSSHLKI